MLFAKIKEDRMAAMKAKNAITKTILTTLVGELEGQSKRDGEAVTDIMVIGRIKKFIDANKDSLSVKSNPVLDEEIVVLESYLPKQMSESELREAISTSGERDIGGIMKYLSANHRGKYAGALASKIVKEMF